MRYILLFAILGLFSCATYQGKVETARTLLQSGQFSDALAQLKVLADQPGNDRLIYLLDYATALQISGNYTESNKYFQMADKFADIQDYTSLSLETGSFLFGEEMVQYKGEDFEVVLINAMTAINYLCLGDLDNAMVEVRRLNEKLRRFRLEAKRKFTDNALAIYLSAVIYEANKSWDDAAIAYEQVFKIDPSYHPLREDLIRSNVKARRFDAVKKWKAAFPEVVENPDWKNDKMGEVVVIYQQGWGPRKNFRQDNFRYPAMYPVWSGKLSIVPKIYPLSGGEAMSFGSFKNEETVFSVERIAIASLEDQYASLIARRIGGAVVKEVVAARIRKDNQLLGDIALLAMYASDRADLRQWSTLPRTFKIYRLILAPGDYKLDIDGQEKNNKITLKSGEKFITTHRSL
jgi:hypothetical protein